MAMALVLSVCLVGCTSMKTVEAPATTAPSQVEKGDAVRVTTKAGHTYALEITAVSDTAMTGRDDTGKLWKVPFDQIQTLQVEQISAARTAGATAGGIGIVAVTLYVLGAIAFGKALDEWGEN